MSKRERNSLLSHSLVRYVFTGGVGFAVEILTIWLFVHLLGTSSVVAVAVSFWIGLIASFLMQKLFTFRNAEHSSRAISRQTLLFAGLVGINYGFTLLFVGLVDPFWNSPTLARACALLITTAWNYVVYKHVIFRS